MLDQAENLENWIPSSIPATNDDMTKTGEVVLWLPAAESKVTYVLRTYGPDHLKL